MIRRYLYAYFSGIFNMADVFGEIGGQPVELNNAATEATLKQLLQANLAMAQKMGADVKQQADMEKEMKKFFDQLDKSKKGLADSQKKREEELKAAEKLAAAKQREAELAQKSEMITVGLGKGLEYAADKSLEYANKLTSVMSSFANMGNSFSGAASVFSNIPIVGGLLSNVFGAIASAADKLQKSFIAVGGVGATFGGSIRSMVAHATEAGLTFDQFAQVIRNNSEDLARFGGSTTEGAKRLSQMSVQLKKSGLQDDLARLGFSAEEIANGMASVTGRLYRGIGVRAGQEGEAAKVSAEYLKNLTAISSITGKNREAMEKEAAARMADSKFRSVYAKLDVDSRKNLDSLMATMGPRMQKGMSDLIATGTATTEEAEELLYMYPEIARAGTEMHASIRRSNKLTDEERLRFDDTLRRTAKAQDQQVKQGAGAVSTLMTYTSGGAANMAVEMQNVAEQTGNVRQAQAQQTTELNNAREAAKKHSDSLDPANMLRMQQEIAKTSNEFNVLLAEYLPKLQEAFSILADFVKTYLVPVFRFFMDHLKEIVYAIAGVTAALYIVKKGFEAFKLYQEFKNLGKERGSTPANPMFVEDVTGSGKGGVTAETPEDRRKRREKTRDKLKSAKTAGRLVKGVAGVGTVISAGMLYSDISDINEREKAGEITAQQAKMEKGGAVGEATGGLGGALGGAAAGAAIGSVVPVVGTVIGGLIGGALGGWLGSNLGETIGKNVAKPTATPEWMKINGPNIKSWADAVAKGSYKFEQVPDIYKGHVQDLLDKKGSGGGAPAVPATPSKPDKGSPEWMKVNGPNIQSWVDAVSKGSKKFDDVPDVYKPYVKAELDKLPKTAQTTSTSASPTATSSTGINYGARPEDVLKQFAKAQGVIGTPSTTTTGNVQVMTEQMRADAAKKQLDEQNARDAEQKKQQDILRLREENKPIQENPNTMLASLNKTMVDLLKSNKELIDINEKQLAVQRRFSGDVFTV